MLRIDQDRCNSCKLCEKSCPFGAIAVTDEGAQVNELCTVCGACVGVCPQGALSIERRQVSARELAEFSGVFVWVECEPKEGRLLPKKVVYELLAIGRRLADQLDQELCAVVAGDERLQGLESLCHHGADRVLCCRHALLAAYSTDGFTSVICAVIAQEKPSVFLCGATANGRDLAPRVAARLKLGLTADCTDLAVDEDGQLLQTRPAFGGNIMATIISPYTRPQMATVRPNVFAADGPDLSRAVDIVAVPVTLNKAAIRTRVVGAVCTESCAKPIDEADILVSAGRGCQDAANLEMVQTLADRLDGALAGSRAIVEMGWIPHSLQVGQSGTTVCPDLYIALGISGAVQHVVGMSSSKKIIAINRDPEAPIFKIADLGVVGDALKVLPRLLTALESPPGSAARDREGAAPESD